eukprot:1157797-Pelagomonas_calceolata.AAC.10
MLYCAATVQHSTRCCEQMMAACTGLHRCDAFTHCVRSGQPTVSREFACWFEKKAERRVES